MGRLIQGLVLFSTLLGVFFLFEVYPLLPGPVFGFLTVGWLLFVFDSLLTFIRSRLSFYFGFVLAILTLAATLSQPEHYSLVASGNLVATATLLLGSAAQVGLVILVPIYERERRRS